MSAHGIPPVKEQMLLAIKITALVAEVPGHAGLFDPFTKTADAMSLAFIRHLQITICERCVRVGQVVEHYADYGGCKAMALRYAICRAAVAP